MAKKPQTIPLRMNRDQLYSMAAKSSFGENTELVIDATSRDDDGSVTFAVLVRETAPESQHYNEAHANGYTYYRMDRDGNIKYVPEGEL